MGPGRKRGGEGELTAAARDGRPTWGVCTLRCGSPQRAHVPPGMRMILPRMPALHGSHALQTAQPCSEGRVWGAARGKAPCDSSQCRCRRLKTPHPPACLPRWMPPCTVASVRCMPDPPSLAESNDASLPAPCHGADLVTTASRCLTPPSRYCQPAGRHSNRRPPHGLQCAVPAMLRMPAGVLQCTYSECQTAKGAHTCPLPPSPVAVKCFDTERQPAQPA